MDILESSSSAQRLLELFAQLEADALLENPVIKDIEERLRQFLREPREKHNTEFDTQHFQELCTALLQIIQSPTYTLRKKYRIATGPLESFSWVKKISDVVLRHQTCSSIIRLEGHD